MRQSLTTISGLVIQDQPSVAGVKYVEGENTTRQFFSIGFGQLPPGGRSWGNLLPCLSRLSNSLADIAHVSPPSLKVAPPLGLHLCHPHSHHHKSFSQHHHPYQHHLLVFILVILIFTMTIPILTILILLILIITIDIAVFVIRFPFEGWRVF